LDAEGNHAFRLHSRVANLREKLAASTPGASAIMR
jgi:hypothetical protein